MDIVIPDDKLGDFFFMNDEEEKARYGASANYSEAALLTQQLVKSAEKHKSKKESDPRDKQMMEFKVRAVDFLAIYVKQRSYKDNADVHLKLIRGLLKGLSTAHADKHTILFERIKSVFALMAKQGANQGADSAEAGQQTKSSNDTSE